MVKIPGYDIIRQIGSGGMAMVYLAEHPRLGNKLAIKVLSDVLTSDESVRKRFVQEAKLMVALRHHGIVTVTDFVDTEHTLAIVMDYVDGRTLDDMIGVEVGAITHDKALPIFKQILEAVSYAHSKGVVHRDIKPSNVLVAKDGEVKVTDFGIAKIAGQKGLTRTGAQMGTLYYESPEQIKGARDVDHRADIYSLGMTLYEMLAGRLPFDDASDTSEYQIMDAIVRREDHLDPRDYYPHIPEWLVEVVQKATHLNPAERFQSCKEFIEAINGQKAAKVAPNVVAHSNSPVKTKNSKKTVKATKKDRVSYSKGKGNSGGGADAGSGGRSSAQEDNAGGGTSLFKKKKWLLPVLIILPILIVGAILIFGVEKIECQYCDQKFSPENIEAHIHGEHWFPCIYCDTVLHSEAELNSHITQEHTIECLYCLAEIGVSDIFRTQAELISHLDSAHVFACIHCDTILHSQLELDEHILAVHNFQCEYCEEVFFTQEELDEHIISDHTYTCPVCSEVFPTYAERQAHFAANHDRFIKSGNVITDFQTNLQWQVGPDSDTTWNEANSWVNGLGGSWRMPSMNELRALNNAGIKYGDWGYFQNSGYRVWSSQTEGSSFVTFFNGSEGDYYRTVDGEFRAFAVRSR